MCFHLIPVPICLCRYLHFDFHHICGHVHFERLSILYDQIEDFIVKNRYGFFSVALSNEFRVIFESFFFFEDMDEEVTFQVQKIVCQFWFFITWLNARP